MTTPKDICHACGHTATIKTFREFKTKGLTGTYHYCANCYTKIINSFTHRPKYNETYKERKKELCLKPITPR